MNEDQYPAAPIWMPVLLVLIAIGAIVIEFVK
jgi:hypothetical protein